MPSSRRPPSPEPGRVRSRLAAALLGLAWTWGFWNSGGVSLEARSHLLTLSSLAVVLALWPGRGTTGHGQRLGHRRRHWLSGLVGLGLYGGTLVAPVIQLPTWILALLAWTTWQVGRCVLGGDPWLRRALPSGLLAVCLVQALLGLWQAAQGEVVRGTLGNPNHFAGAMALAGGLVAGWLLVGPWWVDGEMNASTWGPWTGRWAAGGVAVLLLTVVVLGQSRGGLAVLLAVWGLAYLRWRSAGGGATGVGRAKARGLMLWGGVAFAVTWWTVPRLSVDGLERRLQVYTGTLQLIADHPWGVGPGLYRWLFRPYQRLESNKFFDYAHNDYLQLVAEWGWLAGGALLAWLVWRWIGAWHLAGWHLAGSEKAEGASLAVLAAVTAPLLHAWVDFDLHIPVLLMAVSALLAWTAASGSLPLAKGEVISGSPPLAKGELEGDLSLGQLSVGGAGLGREIPPNPPFLKGGTRENQPPFSKGGARARPWPDRLIWVGLTVVAVLACWRVEVLAFASASVRGSDDPAVYAGALEHAPEAPSLHFGLAMLRRDAVEHRSPKLAYEHFQEAIRLNPHSWRYRFELGRFYEQMGRDDDAALAYGEALQRNPWEADDQRRIAGFYLRRGTRQGKALGRALLAQSAAEDRRLLRAGGELLLASGHGLRELVAWWPRDGTSQPDLLAVLCAEFSERPLESDDIALLENVWRRGLEADGSVNLEAGDVYPDLLWQQGQGAEARARWLQLLEAEGRLGAGRLADYGSRRNELWNGDFESPLRRSVFSWRVPVGTTFAVSRVAGEGLDGGHGLLIDFDGTPKLDFKRLRQHVALEPRGIYELIYHTRTKSLQPSTGLSLQVLDVASRQLLWRGESVAGTTPWQRRSGRFEMPSDDGRIVLRVARGPNGVDASMLEGQFWLDGLTLRRLDVPPPTIGDPGS